MALACGFARESLLRLKAPVREGLLEGLRVPQGGLHDTPDSVKCAQNEQSLRYCVLSGRTSAGQPRFLSSRHQHLTLRRRPSPRCATFPLVTAVTNGRLGTLSVSNASFGTSPPDNKLRGIGF